MNTILIPCDICGKIFEKPTNKIKQMNFCSRECLNRHNSRRFSTYNETENPMNAKGRTIEERFAMRNRRINAKDRIGKETHTYNKHLGEPEHRRIMKLKLGRDLTSDEVVHHIDRDPFNNKPSNLTVMSRSEHTRLHIKECWRNQHEKK